MRPPLTRAAPLHPRRHQERVKARQSRARMLDITVSDPETHTQSKVSAFVDFKIHTITDDNRYATRDFFVRRRYRDFLWLRQQLDDAYPGAIVPPLPPPDKPYKGEFDRFSTHFIQRRQAGLELFLRRVAAHSTLAGSTTCSPSSRRRCGSCRRRRTRPRPHGCRPSSTRPRSR